ncbi:MAG: anaerobic ribonucleoside-triphosphate reductase activating protein [Clostridia bacterium]|nr:anaerobic ribonucleoside-triphosphate reductase activating protein [Clostridia bacterium]
MKILGFQKMTMLDFPGKIACTIFTAGCNFRCPFCHNAPLVTHIDGQEFSQEEILSYLNKRKGMLDGVCITGGEPLLQKDIKDLIIKIKELGYAVKLDTNGSFPDVLKSLVSQNLIDYVAMDVKNSPSKYALTADASESVVEKVDESIKFLLSGAIPYEFRTTVVKEFHTPTDFEEIGKWIEGADAYYLQAFVDSGDLIGTSLNALPKMEMEQCMNFVRPFVKKVEIRGI